MTYLDTLKKLAQAATPGPWKWDGDVCAYDHEQEAPWLVNERGKKVLYGQIDCDNSWSAQLIAALSPERVLAMLDVIEAAKAMREWHHKTEDAPSEFFDMLDAFDSALAALERSDK